MPFLPAGSYDYEATSRSCGFTNWTCGSSKKTTPYKNFRCIDACGLVYAQNVLSACPYNQVRKKISLVYGCCIPFDLYFFLWSSLITYSLPERSWRWSSTYARSQFQFGTACLDQDQGNEGGQPVASLVQIEEFVWGIIYDIWFLVWPSICPLCLWIHGSLNHGRPQPLRKLWSSRPSDTTILPNILLL